ncbi:MAG: hypothetical protein KIS81_04800 [Maricaulaceae bacterium]|nr:hypothetical protein [Maricaulaceae bacterium]
MAFLDAVLHPPFFGARKPKARKRRGPVREALADFMASAVRPGDKTLQIGACDAAAADFLNCGAFHMVVGPASAAEAVEAECAARGINPSRLRVFPNARASEIAGQVDAVYLAPVAGFAALAANWRHAAARLKTAGVLVVEGIDRPDGARLYDSLRQDAGWRLDETISGAVAVFRKTAAFSDES